MAKPPDTNFCPGKYILELPLQQISISNETVTILIILHLNPQLPTHGLHTKKQHSWAGSNIYWDGSKLTFDTAISNDSDLKQGVHFRWGSLIGIPSSGNSAPSAYYIPIYNPTSPQNSTWDCKSYDFNSIYCFYNVSLVTVLTQTIPT